VCGDAPGSENHSWAAFNNDGTRLLTANTCGAANVTGQSAPTSGLAAADVLGLMTTPPSGDAAGWTFVAPVGDAISGIVMDRDLYFGLGSGWFPEVVDASGTPLSGELCSFVMGQTGCEMDGSTTHSDLNTSALAIQLVCDAAPFGQTTCLSGSSFHHARVELNSATVSVTDNQPPTLTGSTGSLFGSTGYQHGSLTGTISGADNSGVASVRVYVDGNAVVQSAFNCDYTYAQPCPATATSPALTLDTTRLADGSHQVQAAVVDAAGNETRGPVQQLLVANHPPAAPVGLAVTNAPSGWINHSASIAWKNPPQGAGLPVAGVDWVTCRGADATIPASGCGTVHSQTTPLTSLTEDPRTEAAFAGQLPASYTVFVWLVDTAGQLNPAGAGRVTFGFDNSTPGPPTSLKATPTASGKSFEVEAATPAHVAPITSVNWVACRAGGKCTSPRNVTGDRFGFDPATNTAFKAAPRGRYVLHAWLEDAAGNTSSRADASTTVTYPVARHAKSTSRAPSPRLRVTLVTPHGRDLRVAGTASRTFDGHVRLVEHFRLANADHVLRHTATAAAGHFSTELPQPRGAHAERVSVSFAGDRDFRAETVTHTLAHA
jgi:hypothetical protein